MDNKIKELTCKINTWSSRFGFRPLSEYVVATAAECFHIDSDISEYAAVFVAAWCEYCDHELVDYIANLYSKGCFCYLRDHELPESELVEQVNVMFEEGRITDNEKLDLLDLIPSIACRVKKAIENGAANNLIKSNCSR